MESQSAGLTLGQLKSAIRKARPMIDEFSLMEPGDLKCYPTLDCDQKAVQYLVLEYFPNSKEFKVEVETKEIEKPQKKKRGGFQKVLRRLFIFYPRVDPETQIVYSRLKVLRLKTGSGSNSSEST
jgi:hypothetical protein